MSRSKAKVLSPDVLKGVRDQLRTSNLTVVQCHGCFDIVHPGHVRHLRFAKDQGDILIVSITADAVVGKGVDRPYIHQDLRAESLAALECVDYVCIDDNSTADSILRLLCPDVYVKGREYETKGHAGFLKEKAFVESYGGRIVYSSGDVVYSSTSIISDHRDRFDLDEDRIAFFCRQHGITIDTARSTLNKFPQRRILVVGDSVLDNYIFCGGVDTAPDTPVLSVAPVSEEWYPSAGAFLAIQSAGFGASVTFLTLADQSPEAARLADSFGSAQVELVSFPHDERPTYVRTVYVVGDRKVLKVNNGRSAPLSTETSRRLTAEVEKRLPQHDGVILSDNGSGLLNREVIESVRSCAAKSSKPYYCHVRPNLRMNMLAYTKVRLALVTEQQLRFTFADNESGVSHLAFRYYQHALAERLLLSMGKRGLVLFEPPRSGTDRLRTDHLPGFSGITLDATGCTESFLATAVLADISAAPPTLGAYLGACMASVQAARFGSIGVTPREGEAYLAHRKELSP